MTTRSPDELIAKVAELLRAHKWHFASTMAYNPHYYTLRREWSSVREFEAVVRLIHELGKPDYFADRFYIALDVDGRHYWTMGESPRTCPLINMKITDASGEDAVNGVVIREPVGKRGEK